MLLTGLALIVGTACLVTFSSLFATTEVSVSGAAMLSADQVRGVANVELGLPLVRQDTGAISVAVSGLKPVRSVTVTRSWPHTVKIAVTERTPLLAVGEPGGFLLVDDQGAGFETVPQVPRDVLLTLVDSEDPAVLRGVGVVAASLSGGLRDRVSQIQVGSLDAITLQLRDGDTVFWGSPEQSAEKAAVTAVLLRQAGRHFDVSAPLNVTRR